MRIPAFLRNLLLLLAIASPVLLSAQFQKPTDEELKMTADPKAPGAAAVYLNIEEIDNDLHLYSQSFYVRIKVLAEKGKELATVEIPPYLDGLTKIIDIKARTIHPDGTIIPLEGKPQELLVAKIKYNISDERIQTDYMQSRPLSINDLQVKRMVFTLPSVEVGSILEYQYTIRNDWCINFSQQWMIQRPYFVHKAHYLFIPFKAYQTALKGATGGYIMDTHLRSLDTLLWMAKLPPGVTVKSDMIDHYTVDVTDVPPAPDEEYMPPIQSLLYRVFFYYKAPSANASDFWNTDGKLWSKNVDHLSKPSKSFVEAISGLIAPTDSDLDKARKLYKAVQSLDNTDFSRNKPESDLKQFHLNKPRHVNDTWEQKSGDSEDIALLYLAMLRSFGLNAYAFKVVDRDKGVFDTSFLTMQQLDDILVVLNIDGKEIILDPGEKMCPFQTVSWRHSGAGGIMESAKANSLATSPEQIYTDNKTLRVGNITLDSHGALTGSFRFEMIGQEALRWRQAAISNDLDEVKKRFDKSLESIVPDGVEAHVDHFTGLDNSDVNLVAFVNAKGNLGSATSNRLMLPAFFFETRGTHPFVSQKNRLQPVDMRYGETIADQVAYHLPAGLAVEGAPKDDRIAWPQHANLVIKSVQTPNQITIVRSLARAFTFAKPEEYQELRGFYQKIATADQQQLVLTTTAPATKDN
jgi:hypothetical protein